MVEQIGTGQGGQVSEVKWLPEALADIERLHEFLKQKSPDAAVRMVETILTGVQLLQNAPHVGRLMPDDTGRRELSMAFGSGAYVLRHKLEGENTVVIIRVWHSRERRNTE